MVHRLDQLKAEEVELLKQCAELEQLLRSDPLSFENEALEVQLQQIHADHAQLLEELKGTREFYGRRINDMTSQLEDRSRATCTAQGHADCLGDLLLFHEDNGTLAGSYWRTQCVKRDDSIRFLSLKLQEYTVNSAEYHKRRSASFSGDSEVEKTSAESPTLARTASAPIQGVNQAAFKAAERAFKALNERHSGLCEELQRAEEQACKLEQAIETCELRCAGLDFASENDESHSDLKDEIRQCQDARASAHQLPSWALRCAWRDALDLRAAQLERVSAQLDSTKRSFDAANEELNWHATSAEALRTRLADVLRATAAEKRRGSEALAEEVRRKQTLQELLDRWFALRPEVPVPTACAQAQQLLAECEGS
ncbi:unnamed protein product [Cladocopium goreaui]|uniref:Uncharacterized protein n=1 Tax=Cladocopium goreaui TaxID=2562237 RepID=A0A9P1DFE2_9DINO|nr:unnamed protein product [Cladocopium goreaui]